MNDDERLGSEQKGYLWNQAVIGTSISGLDYLRKIQAGLLQEPPVADLIGASIQEVKEGVVVLEIEPSERHYNIYGNVMGGVIAAVIDAATASAIISNLAAGIGCTTINLSVQYVRPITVDVGKMRCEARVIQVNNDVGRAEAKLVDRVGKIYAFGSCCCMILR